MGNVAKGHIVYQISYYLTLFGIGCIIGTADYSNVPGGETTQAVALAVTCSMLLVQL